MASKTIKYCSFNNIEIDLISCSYAMYYLKDDENNKGQWQLYLYSSF